MKDNWKIRAYRFLGKYSRYFYWKKWDEIDSQYGQGQNTRRIWQH